MPFCKGPVQNQTKVPFQVSRKPQGRRPHSNGHTAASAAARVPLSSSGAASARQIRPRGNNQQKIQGVVVVQSSLASVRLVAFGTVRKAWPAFVRCGAGVRVSDVARLVPPQTKAGEGTPEDPTNLMIYIDFRTLCAFGPTVLRTTRRPADIRPAPQPMRSPQDPRDCPACLRRIVRHSWQRAEGRPQPSGPAIIARPKARNSIGMRPQNCASPTLKGLPDLCRGSSLSIQALPLTPRGGNSGCQSGFGLVYNMTADFISKETLPCAFVPLTFNPR